MVRFLKPMPFIKLVKVEDENLKKDMKEAEDLLMSSLGINLQNFSGSEEEMEQSLEILPKDFPYDVGRVDEKAYKEKPIFSFYKGPVYWNDHLREVGVLNFNVNISYPDPEKPVRIHEGGDKPLTVQELCEAIARIGFNPGNHCFLEEFDLTMRKINGDEVITIVFTCGS